MFDQTTADVGAIFNLATMMQGEFCDAQLFVQAAGGAEVWIFLPIGVRATGVRPLSGRVVFTHGALLDQNMIA